MMNRRPYQESRTKTPEKFKTFVFGATDSEPMHMICAGTVDVGALLRGLAAGSVSEGDLGDIIIAQAQNAEWAQRIVAALNAI